MKTNPKLPTQPETEPAEPPRRNLTLTARAEFDLASAATSASPLPRFRMVAYTGTPMRVAGWRYPVVVDLTGLSIPSQSRPIRFSHDASAGVGHTDQIQVIDGRLEAAGIISRDTAAAREVVASSRNGFPWQASIGASVEEFEFVKEQQTVTVNGQEYSGPLNVVRKSVLSEISFVDLGADGRTSAAVAAASRESGDRSRKESGEKQVMGMDTAATTNHDTSNSNVEPEHLQSPASRLSPVQDIRAQAADELDRIASIRRQCAGQYPEIEATAIREGWDETRTELEILRRARPAAPAVHVPVSTVDARVLEAACLLTGRVENIDAMFDSQTIDTASQRFRGGIGLQELLIEAAWANGYTGRNFRDSRTVLRYAFNPNLEAGFSTIDIGGILSNVANKFLLDGFYSVERTWRNITAVRNVSDFKTVTSYRLIGTDQYEQVQPGGELKHGTLGEEKYENRADTYGLMLSIDRRDIINDDLDAITAIPRKLGRGSGLKINDVFWSTFMKNSQFFKSTNNNFISGVTTALSIDGLTQAEVTFMEQVDAEGKPIGIMPSTLLVPPALSAIGSQLFKSMELRVSGGTNKESYPVANPHQNKFRVEVSRYLSNPQYTGNSSKAWYLLADPSDLPVIEVAFLNGQESPTIETAEADFNRLGVQMRGYHDFGVALQDHRGGIKAKGEA